MTFKDAMNWLLKALKYTAIGAGFGAATGASSGSVGNAIVLSLSSRDDTYTVRDGTLATTAGSAIAGGTIGFISAIPAGSTANIFECLTCCGPGIGLFVPVLGCVEQALCAVIGVEILKKLLDDLPPLDDAAINAGIGSIFTMAFMVVLVVFSWCLPDRRSEPDYENSWRDGAVSGNANAIEVVTDSVEAPVTEEVAGSDVSQIPAAYVMGNEQEKEREETPNFRYS